MVLPGSQPGSCFLVFSYSRALGHPLTFLDDVDDVIGVEAELVRVLSIIGIQGLALRHLWFGLGLGLGPAPCWGRPAGRLSADTVDRGGLGETQPAGSVTLLQAEAP